ncbi:hypothetical protein B7P43_G04448 [Cryptotermes secundus]|uniref:Uncharacterized protein n=1 Tax=Cryptotermes secundus TaxID=105785 RepID=A0A2J7QC73_9NEOP|nr:uncharacterized protein LOC111868502 [Cryptotermes secundus]PNF26172.1 hypothetical protein B7P43_G04448 [Cryptotermes secundus]
MATKVLLVLLASHCVPATDVTSLIASNYAKVFRTGSFASTETDISNRDELYDERHLSEAEVTTDASDIYRVYYPVMEAQVVTDSNDTEPLPHAPRVESSRTANSESPVSVLQLNPLASFINAFFRQPVYVGDNNEEMSGSSLTQDSAYDEVSKLSDTTKIPPTIKQPRYSHESSSQTAESPHLFGNGRTAKYTDEGYTELVDEEQNIQYVNSHKYPPPVGRTSPLLKDAYQPTVSDESYKLNVSLQPTKLETSFEPNRLYQSEIPNSYKLPESYPPATLDNPRALTEPYQPTPSENPYKLSTEQDQTSAAQDEEDSYSYGSERRVAANGHSAVSPPQKHEMATGREKNPYTYFYVGRKLWYIPLFFSVYFMLYVLALVARSISRHKIVFPVTKTKYEKRELNSGLEDITYQVTTAMETTERLYL